MENPKRKGIGKTTRFNVFKRDSFTCQYCSAKPPKVPLEVDHIIPVCKGGSNSIDNLITACFDCNRGKAGNELTNVPLAISEKIEMLKLATSQYRVYQKLLDVQKKQNEHEIKIIEDIYTSSYPEWCFNDKFKISVRNFISKLGIEEVSDAMERSCLGRFNSNTSLRYFCGICWNKIKER